MATSSTSNGTVRITSEPLTYRVGGEFSYFADLTLAEHPERERGNASRERLLRHEHELQVEYRSPTVSYADPPRYLIDRFATFPRPERTLLNLIEAAGNLIPIAQKPGFSSITTLRLTTGTSTPVDGPGQPVTGPDIVEAQVPTGTATGPAGATSSTGTSGGFANSTTTGDSRDPTTASRVALISGNADIPMQMLEQSGAGQAHLDTVLWKDLTSAYDAQVELQLLTGTGGSGPFAQLLGLLNVTGINAITYTDATPTATKWIQVQATLTGGGAAPQALAAIGNKRDRKPEVWMMTTSRAAWVAASEVALPLALANQRGPGAFDLLAYPVMENDSIPTNFGVGGNQDVVIACRPSDLLVFESAPTLKAHTETLAGNLEARIQYRCHVGALLGRYPSGISVISGTGMAVQTSLGF